MNDHDLLKVFREERSEEAFAQLVRRYAGLVYSVAKRRLGNANLAEDITQIVFIRFAKTPPKVQSEAELAAWLHRTTVNVTIDTWRSETRRRNREEQTVVMESTTPETTLWEELSPNLDEALNQLHDEDRQALMLRFFGQKTMRDVGAALGVSEDAAKMRVSRALDRMRTKLGVCGTACTATVLELILDQRSVQAAPVQLVSRLAAMKLPRVAAAAGTIGLFGALLRTSKLTLAAGAVVLTVIVVSIVHLTQPPHELAPEGTVPDSQINLTSKTNEIASRARLASSGFIKLLAPPTKPVKTFFHVLEAESGAEMAASRIRAVYFGAGGTEEGHDLLADNTGTAALPEPDDATKTQGMNVFAVADGHVPKAVNFHGGQIPADYTMKLDRALTAGGLVVDEHGVPIAGVKIMIQGPGVISGQAENVDFQTCPVTNNADGSWSCSYLPTDSTEVRFILKKDGYAVTLPVVPVSQVDLTNLVLVINRGFTVTGHITDPQNRPIANARIKNLSRFAKKRQSASTDEHGVFSLEGVDDFNTSTSPPLETNGYGAAIVRGLAGEGPFHVDLAVQAEGFAPQTKRLELHDATNIANFTLSSGNIFRGRVVDEMGNPIPNAVIRTDFDFKNQTQTQLDWTTNTDGNGPVPIVVRGVGDRQFDWTTNTDGDGRFEWDSAPANEICYWFEADGYTAIRGMPLLADGSYHEITLERDAIK